MSPLITGTDEYLSGHLQVYNDLDALALWNISSLLCWAERTQ
jgi:hypothetical protein